ncbi:MAG: hypothetical protein JJU46_04250 [Balneolaceae bacterium]|nr:hypothetical protein [Balneolaceae bacterium]
MNGRLSYSRWSAVSIFFLSVAVIALQLLIMRALAVTHYHHFSYLVISTALLGFGASGTFLALFFDRLKDRFYLWNLVFLTLFLVAVPACFISAQLLPLDTQYVLYSRSQLMLLISYNLLMFIPFFFGGTSIGFVITYHRREVPELYAANLLGSGAGGVTALGLIYLLPASQLPVLVMPLIFLAILTFTLIQKLKGQAAPLALISVSFFIVIAALFAGLPDRVDPYKELARFQQLEAQQDAEQVEQRFGPRGQIDVFSSPSFHYTLFAGPHATVMPPPQLALLTDGDTAGAIFRIDDPERAEIMDFTPQSLPYRLAEPQHVLILGEASGVNVWLAKRMGAEKITVVQTNPQLIRLMESDLREEGGAVFQSEGVEVIREDPRIYLEQSDRQYDLIHLAIGESMATGTGGLQGLSEDFLLTTESIAAARQRLSENGLISVTRGIQSPPRDNLKMAAMFLDALSRFSDDDPASHLLVSRNYLAANIMLSKAPVDEDLSSRFRDEARQLQMDVEYYPGIQSDLIEQMNIIEGPDGQPYSWIHHGVRAMLSDDSESFFAGWAYNVRPPTDNSPYFHDYFLWSSIDRFLESYGDRWFQRVELGYMILVITFVQLAVAAFLLILLPLAFRWRHFAQSNDKLPTLLYFSLIGTGFMFIEMTLLQTFTRYLGDPIISAAAILSSILVFSGLGSYSQKRIPLSAGSRIAIASCSISLLMILYLLIAEPLLGSLSQFGGVTRFVTACLLLFPVSFFFGWMFPAGIQKLEKTGGKLVPWAWGVDGFASVTAAPLAVMLAMTFGFSHVILLGILCYAGAGITGWLWR